MGENEICLSGESSKDFRLLKQIFGDVFSKGAVDFKFSFIEELIARRFVWKAGDLSFVELNVLGFVTRVGQFDVDKNTGRPVVIFDLAHCKVFLGNTDFVWN